MSQTPAIPSRAELLWPALCAVREIGGSGTIREIDDKVIELEGLTEDQQRAPHGNDSRTEIQYQLAWSRTYLKAMGLLENSARRVWSLTDDGRRALDETSLRYECQDLRLMWPRAGHATKRDQDAAQAVEEEPEDRRSWKEKLLEALLAMPPAGFERLAQRPEPSLMRCRGTSARLCRQE